MDQSRNSSPATALAPWTVVVCEPDPAAAAVLNEQVGGTARIFHDLVGLHEHVSGGFAEDTIVLGPNVTGPEAFSIAAYMRVHRPTLGVLLVRAEVTAPLLHDALRAGVREVVDVPGLQAAVAASAALSGKLHENTTAGAGPDGPAARGRVVTVFSAKGGCGKTTLATNLAVALAAGGRCQVVVLDLDLSFGDVAIFLRLFPAHTIGDAIPMARSLDSETIRALLTPHSPGLSALVAPLDPSTGEAIPATLVSKIIELLREQFDYVVIDTPAAFDDQVLAAFDVSDVVALIATLDVAALRNLKLTLETLDLLNHPGERRQIVLNRADSKVGLSVKDVEDTLRTTIAAHIPSSRDVPAAVNRGVPIVLDDPRHPVSVAIRTFAEERIPAAPPRGPEPPPGRRRRWR